MSTTERLPPQDVEAEMSVLGAMLLGDAVATEEGAAILKPADFYRSAHGRIFGAMARLIGRAEPVDVVTLKDELNREGILDDVGGLPYLIVLGEFVPTTANLAHYARIVSNKAKGRRLIEAAGEIAGLAYAGETVGDALIEAAESRIMAVRDGGAAASSARTMVEDLPAYLEDLDTRRKGDGIVGLRTGIFPLDWMLSGLEPGRLFILAARPKVGKSALAAQIAYNLATGHGGSDPSPVFFSALEMRRKEIYDRIFSLACFIDSEDIRAGRLNAEQWGKIARASERLYQSPMLTVDDAAEQTLMSLRAAVRRHKSKYGLGAIVIDYLQLMGGEGENRNLQVASIARGLKMMAKDFDVPILALAQLNRDVERENREPRLSDLRDSGALEQDADVVMFLHRDGSASQGENLLPGEEAAAEQTDISLIVAAQRGGRTGAIPLKFTGKYTRFDAVDKVR